MQKQYRVDFKMECFEVNLFHLKIISIKNISISDIFYRIASLSRICLLHKVIAKLLYNEAPYKSRGRTKAKPDTMDS